MTQTVRKTTHPQMSELWRLHQSGDFLDGYAVTSSASVAEAAETAFTMPGWANGLMRLRNALVKPLGLKTGEDTQASDAIFPIHLDTETERVMGTDDNHLNFRISVLKADGNIHIATWVHANNIWGRIYLAVVMPFHILLSRNSLARVARVHPPLDEAPVDR
ncbi:MAG: DUF2867 domain-containing protein [Pelagimonas sp.]